MKKTITGEKIGSYRFELSVFLVRLFFPYLLYSISGAFLIFLMAIIRFRDIAFALYAYLAMIGCILLLLYFFSLLIYIIRPTEVYSDGIYSYIPVQGVCSFMQWESMKKLNYETHYGLKYYVIESRNNEEKIWIPFNLKNKFKFKDIVTQKAGPDNIFTSELVKTT